MCACAAPAAQPLVTDAVTYREILPRTITLNITILRRKGFYSAGSFRLWTACALPPAGRDSQKRLQLI